MPPTGTTPAELRVLSLLSHQPHGAGSPSDIAQWVVQTSGGLTATLKRLEDDGHVERRPDPDDGRGRLVAITDAGRLAHDQVLGAVVERTSVVLGDVDPAVALDAVRDLTGAFERAAGLPSSHGFVAGTPVSPVGSTR